MCVKLILKITILSLLSFFVPNIKGNCISINNEQSNNFFNVSYHEKCYKHTIQQENCCKYFLLNENCQDIYMQCVNYEDYVLNNTVSPSIKCLLTTSPTFNSILSVSTY